LKRHWRIARVNIVGITLLIITGIVLSACGTSGPARSITKGDELANYNFSEAGTFEEGAYNDAVLRVTNGVYRINVRTGDGSLWWGQWGDTYTDTVIDVDVTQVSERPEAAYGVMCRVRGRLGQEATVDPNLAAIVSESTPDVGAQSIAPEATAEATAEATESSGTRPTPTLVATVPALEITPEVGGITDSEYEGDGYLFLIQGSGTYAIYRSRGRDAVALVDWQTSDSINITPEANHLRVICAGDYLAMYINDTLVAQATDDTYREGQVGLVAGAWNQLGVVVEFDNLQISAVVE